MTSTATHPLRSARAGYRLNVRALAAAQKPARGTAAYSRLVNRPLARRVAAAAHLVGTTPNAATALSATASATGLVLLATLRPTPLLGLAIAVLLALGYVLDSVDGQLARLRGSGSAAGEWLDHTVDCAKTCALHLAVLISWYRFAPVEDRTTLLVPAAFLLVDVVGYFGVVTMPLLRAAHRAPAAPPDHATPPPEHPWRTWLLLPNDYGFFCWLFLLVGWPSAFVVAYTAMFALNTAITGLAMGKWWRELVKLDHARAAVTAGAHR